MEHRDELEQEVLKKIRAIGVLVDAGVYVCPPDSQGGFSVSWMRRRLLGSVNHEKLSDSILRALMAKHGFRPVRQGSNVFGRGINEA
jgi:predicted ATPase